MLEFRALSRLLFACSILLALSVVAVAQGQSKGDNGSTFGPVMRAYLGYLSNEQEVVDDRNSRREISAVYYRRNSNRIRALRQVAIKLLSASQLVESTRPQPAASSTAFGVKACSA